jgi:predicted RecB family endonuclease
MSRLAEIESAVETLPRREQRKLLLRLAARLERPATHNGSKASLHDRMKGGCGIVDSGIPDLATNKKHMEGFGRWRE